MHESSYPLKYIYSLDDMRLLDNKADAKRDLVKPLSETKELANLTANAFNILDVCDNEDIASIIYTSGTTGFAKGVMLPHRSLLANLLYATDKLLFKVGAKVLAFLPLAHSYACAFDLMYPVTRGNHINFMDKIPAPKVLLSAMQDLKPNVVLVVPLLIEKIYKRQLQPLIETPKMKALLKLPLLNAIIAKKIRSKLIDAFGGQVTELIAGGAPMNAEVEQFMKKIKFPFTIGYGMTECGPLISYARWFEHRSESSGQIVPLLRCKIDSRDPARIPGEVLLAGEPVFTGYFNNPEATRESLRDGWLHTGDIGTQTKLEGQVHVGGTLGSPSIGGIVTLSGGTFRIPMLRGNYEIKEGSIDFDRAKLTRHSKDEPYLDVLGEMLFVDRMDNEHVINLRLTGFVSQMKLEWSSSSGLNSAQVLTLLMLNRTPDEVRRGAGGLPDLGGMLEGYVPLNLQLGLTSEAVQVFVDRRFWGEHVVLKGNVEVGFLGQQQQEAQLIFRIHDRVQVMSRVRRRITEDDTTFQEESNDVQTRLELKYKMDFKGSVRDILGF